MRYLIAIPAGLLITAGLFYFMSTLIKHGADQGKPADMGEIIEFVRLKQPEETRLRERKVPTKPEPPKPQPSKPKLQVADEQKPQSQDIKMNAPKLAAGLKNGMGPYLGKGGGVAGDAEEMPIVRIRPQYPQKAAMRGIEGFVTVSFTVTKSGGTRDVKVVDSKPPRVFDRAAQKAVLKWRYRPKLVDGNPVERIAYTTLEFKLSDN